MSKTTDFIINNPGQNFDGTPIAPFDLPEIPTYEALLPTKATIELAVSDFKEKLLEGQIDYREALLRKKVLTDMLEAAFKDPQVKDYLEEQYAKEGTKSVDYKGVKMAYTQRKNYTYDKCGDTEWCMLKQEADSATCRLKDRQKFLESLKAPMTIVNEMTGEVEQIFPAAFTTTDFFTITLPKK